LASSGSSARRRRPAGAQQHRRLAVDERHAHDYQLKANLFVTMQEEIGTAGRMMRVSRDALTSELSLGRCCSAAKTAWRGRSTSCRAAALRASPTGADIVSRICQLVGARDDEHAFAVAARRRLPTRSRSGTVCRRARRRCRFTAAPTKIMLKYCGGELDPKSRTLRLPLGRGRAAEWRWRRAPTFVLVRPSELMSRAWMKDTADAHARDCPNIKRIIKPVQPHQPLGGVGNSSHHRRRADAPRHAQALHRAGALLPRRAETCTRMYAVYVGLNQWRAV
jgi:hypothetical protein